MWIVRLALRRTYTFVVLALLIAVLGGVSIYRMSTDIFPNIDIPIVRVVWQYTGMPADDIETRIILINERVLTASVNDIEHIESQSLDGVGVIRIYFQPGAKIAEAEAQVTATCQTLLKVMPPGITLPYIVRYSATSVPIPQIAVISKWIRRAILDEAAQIVAPALLSTVSICSVFVPVVLLTGPAAYLIVPLALAVVITMLASYRRRPHRGDDGRVGPVAHGTQLLMASRETFTQRRHIMFRSTRLFGSLVLLAGTLVLGQPSTGQAQHGGGHGGGGHISGIHAGGYGGGFYSGYHRGYPYAHESPYRAYHHYYPYHGYSHYGYGGDYYPSYGYSPYAFPESGYGGDPVLGDDSETSAAAVTGDGGTYPYNNPSRQPDLVGDGSSRSSASSYSYGALPTRPVVADTRPAASPSDASQPDNRAHVRVRVPAGAAVWIDGQATTSRGVLRTYQSPPLTPGGRYSYDIQARWQDNGHRVTQTQHVEVTAGAEVQVVFPMATVTKG
jgi:uncharacterized protein (TIGR03000 family)